MEHPSRLACPDRQDSAYAAQFTDDLAFVQGINLDPSLYLVKLMVGGIDRSYDEGDEG